MATGPKTDWKLIPDTVRKLEQAFSIGCNVSEACVYGGITRDTYYRWIKENPELSDRLEQLRIIPVLKAKKTIVDNLNNVKVSMWYLERRCPEEFSLKHQLSTNNQIIIQVINYQNK